MCVNNLNVIAREPNGKRSGVRKLNCKDRHGAADIFLCG